jgi:hypothetical protein
MERSSWDDIDLQQRIGSPNLSLTMDGEGSAGYSVGGELNWLEAYPFYDSQQAPFGTEWARELDTLGT